MFPYEAVIIAILNLITEIVKGQPEDVKAQMWKMYIEDVKAWREFFKMFAASAPEDTKGKPKRS